MERDGLEREALREADLIRDQIRRDAALSEELRLQDLREEEERVRALREERQRRDEEFRQERKRAQEVREREAMVGGKEGMVWSVGEQQGLGGGGCFNQAQRSRQVRLINESARCAVPVLVVATMVADRRVCGWRRSAVGHDLMRVSSRSLVEVCMDLPAFLFLHKHSRGLYLFPL